MTHVISKKYLSLFFFFLCIFLLLTFLGTRGVMYSDEGYILNGAARITENQIPYKDFHFVYTPFSLYITAFAFMLFGKSILIGRILMIVLSFLTSVILLLLFKKITKNIIISSLGVLLYIVWAPIHINFPWPILFAISFGIFSLYFFLGGIQEKQYKYFIFSGFFAFLVVLTKQNFGSIMILNFLIAFYFIPAVQKIKVFTNYLCGFVVPVILYILYLFCTESLIHFLSNFYVYTIERIVMQNSLTTPFMYGETLFIKIAKFFFYTAPLLLGGLATFVSFQKDKAIIFLPVFVCLFYVVGIRPTTDYVHLAPLLSLLSIPMVILWEGVKDKIARCGILLITVVFIGLGLYSAFFVGYYRWEPPLVAQNQFVSLPRTNIFLEAFHKDEIEKIVAVVNKKTKEDDPIFVNGYMPMLYFFTDRKNPTKFDLIEPTDFYIPYEKNVIGVLKKQHVSLVITKNELAKDYLSEYIKKEYNKTVVIHNFSIWEKKHL